MDTEETPKKREREPTTPSPTESERRKVKKMATKDELDLKGMVWNLTQSVESMRNEVKMMRTEIVSEIDEKIQDALSNRFTLWEREKIEMNNKHIQLESRIDEMERRERKNNVIFYGLERKQEEPAKSAVENLLREKLGQQIVIREAIVIGNESRRQLILVKCNSFDDKLKIMRNKAKLDMIKNNEKVPIYVSDDLIKKDRMIQSKARQFAKDKKTSGFEAKVGHKKVLVNGKWHQWDETTETFAIKSNFQ